MKLKRFQLFLIILLVAFATSCSNESLYRNVAQVNYGTSFGMCVGYCKHDVSIDSMYTSYSCAGWTKEVEPTLYKVQTAKSAWDSVKVLINNKAFFELPATIGCPDCADGGAEWVEVKLLNGTAHKVVFEYYNEPQQLQSSIAKLRQIAGKNKCK
jgi:hypothetical protein